MAIRTFIGTFDGDPNNAANYLEGYVPVTGDDMYFELATVEIDANLEALSGVVLDSLNIALKAGKVGNADLNGDYFKIAAKIVNVGYENGFSQPTPATRIKLHLLDTSVSCVVNIFDGATSSADNGQEPIRLKIEAQTGDDATVNVHKGRVAIADQEPGETSTLATLSMTYKANRVGDAQVVIGNGVTIVTINKLGGLLTLRSAVTTLNNTSGKSQILGEGAVGTLTVEAGTVVASSTGTIETANANGGTLDLSRSGTARTVTTLNRRGAGTVIYDPDVITVGTLNPGGAVKLAAA